MESSVKMKDGGSSAKNLSIPASNDDKEQTRRLSDSDILPPRRRSHSSLSQCRKQRGSSRSNNVDLFSSSSEKSAEHGPRPSPVGMAASEERRRFEGNAQSSLESSFTSQSYELRAGVEDSIEDKAEKERKREQAFSKLRSELERAHQELKKRDEECKKLSRVRDDLDSEVEDLTASLFEEANKMVIEAKTKQASAEMQLKEATMKLDGLQAEVNALKLLVITSTPSNPGKKAHRRATSVDQICIDCQSYHSEVDGASEDAWDIIETTNEREVDRIAHRDFVSWMEHHCPLANHPFLDEIEKQDVLPCLLFPNQELATEILKAIQENTLIVEAVAANSKSRRCALSKSSVTCSFRIQLFDKGKWHFISNGCRSRIVAVANLYTNLRYISQGLIRKDANAMYWDLVRLRGQISLSRLGLCRT